MPTLLKHTLANVGRMLDVSPRGKGPASRRVAAIAQAIKGRDDAAMIRQDVAMVGRDLASALSRMGYGE